MASKRILAVGVDLEMDRDVLIEKLSPFMKGIDQRPLILNYKAGVMYGANCRLGSWSGIVSEQDKMRTWYRRHADAPVVAYMRRMYVTDKIILLDGSVDGQQSFSVVISNTTAGTNTFLHKKNANRGHYGKPIDIGTVELSGAAYILYE